MRMFLLRWCPEWLGGWLVQRKWGLRLLGMEAVEPPPILWVDHSGGGWRHPPDWLEPHYEDVGQHDTWKREMRIFLHRVKSGDSREPGRLNLRDIGLSAASNPVLTPRLWPVGLQLAEACRRLGFCRLARAAMPDADPNWLRDVWVQHEAEVEQEALLRKETIEAINRRGGLPSATPPNVAADETRLELSLGAFDLPPHVARSPLHPLPGVSPATPHTTYTRSIR